MNDFEPWYAFINKSLRNFLPPDFPEIVVLCGSTRFYKEFQEANYRETMAGKIVLSVGHYPNATVTEHGQFTGCTPEQKIALDVLHKQKIDMADEVLILNRNGYIGESTRSELEYAKRRGKRIRFLEPLPVSALVGGHEGEKQGDSH